MPERDTTSSNNSLLADLLGWVTGLVARRSRITMWLVLLLTCASAGFTVAHIRFQPQRTDLFDPQAGFHEKWLKYTETFGNSSDIVVVVEARDPATLRAVIDEVGARLEREPDKFTNTLYRVNTRPMRAKGLQMLTPAELQHAMDRVRSYGPVIRDGKWDLIRLQSLVPRLASQLQQSGTTGAEAEALLEHVWLLGNSMNLFLADQTKFKSPWPAVVSLDPRLDQQDTDVVYFLNPQETLGFLKVMPVENEKEFNGASTAIVRIREIITEIDGTYNDAAVSATPQIRISLTGIPVLEYDEMLRTQRDMINAAAIAFVSVGILLFIGFRGIRHPMLALLLLVVGMAWSFGYTTLLVGHINILSVSFAVILIGLGIDFGIHYLSRYLQLRHEGEGLIAALVRTSKSVGPGIVTGAITTALAFFCSTFTEYRGVAELGLISGGGILLCALATFLVLPPLIALADQRVPANRLPTPMQGTWLRDLIGRSPILVLLFSLIVVVGVSSLAFRFEDGRISPRMTYDYNLLNLHAENAESVRSQHRLFAHTQDSLLFAVCVADTWEEAIDLKHQFEQLPTVQRVEELASRIPDNPSSDARAMITALRTEVGRIPRTGAPRFRKADAATVGAALERLYSLIRNNPDPTARLAARSLNTFLDDFDGLPGRHQVAFLDAYENLMASRLLRQFEELAASSSLEPVRMADLPDALKSRFISIGEDDQPRWLLQVYPKEQVWDFEPLGRFVRDVRSVDPQITGTPLQNYEASIQIRASYQTAAMYALAIISLILLFDFLSRGQKFLTIFPPALIVGLIGYTLFQRNGQINPVLLVLMYLAMVGFVAAVLDFRNVRDTFLALLTPMVGALMMLGILSVLDVHLNSANLIALPLVLGIGVDDGVHVLHDFRQQRGRDYRTSASTINAIVLTSLTSMIGFGSLMVSAHQGLYSVGMVLTVGVGCSLFVALIALPSILTLIDAGEQELIDVDESESSDEARQSQRGEQQSKKRRAA